MGLEQTFFFGLLSYFGFFCVLEIVLWILYWILAFLKVPLWFELIPIYSEEKMPLWLLYKNMKYRDIETTPNGIVMQLFMKIDAILISILSVYMICNILYPPYVQYFCIDRIFILHVLFL